MKIEDQVTLLESSKRLKKLGVPQNSLFYWVETYNPECAQRSWSLFYDKDDDDRVNPHVSAFTCAELGEMLPKEVIIGNDIYEFYEICNFKFGTKDTSWGFSYRKTLYFGRWMDWLYSTCEKNEAEARAKMLIYLLENNLIPSERKV